MIKYEFSTKTSKYPHIIYHFQICNYRKFELSNKFETNFLNTKQLRTIDNLLPEIEKARRKGFLFPVIHHVFPFPANDHFSIRGFDLPFARC